MHMIPPYEYNNCILTRYLQQNKALDNVKGSSKANSGTSSRASSVASTNSPPASKSKSKAKKK